MSTSTLPSSLITATAATAYARYDAFKSEAALKQAAQPGTQNAKLRETAENFESMFLNSMLQQMYAGVEGDGPFGNSPGTGVWRSFLTDEYAKTFAKAGGIGIADSVYRELIAQQSALAQTGQLPVKPSGPAAAR